MEYRSIGKETLLYYQENPITALLLGIATWGLYSYWWHYKNWCLVSKNTGNNLYPVFRAYFFPIYTFSLFDLVADITDELNLGSGLLLRIIGLTNVAVAPFWIISDTDFLPEFGVFALFLVPTPILSIWFVQVQVQKINQFLNNTSDTRFGVAGGVAAIFIAVQAFVVFYVA